VPAALVTGAGRGIGLATAQAFVLLGWKVWSLDKAFGFSFPETPLTVITFLNSGFEFR
jgi:hypothetical protein